MRIFLSGPAKGRNEFAGTGAMPKIDDPVEALERCGMGPRTVVIAIALLWAIVGGPRTAVAAELKCAAHSLNRDDQARAMAVARAALPHSARLYGTAIRRNSSS
jgi:hypothetical protein